MRLQAIIKHHGEGKPGKPNKLEEIRKKQNERNRKLIADAEVKLVEGKPLTNTELASLRWLVSQETKVKTFQDPDTREIVRIEPIDLSQAAPNLFKQLMTAPATLGGGDGTAPAAQGRRSSSSNFHANVQSAQHP